MSDNTSFFTYAPIIVALVSLAGLAGVVLTDKDNPQVQANQDNIEFLFAQSGTIQEALVKQSNRSADNTDLIGELEDYDKIITTQIGNIRLDIKNKFPMGSAIPDQGTTSGSSTPFLTLRMDKTEFVLGNVVIFTGTASLNDPVFITLKLPDRSLDSLAISKTQIIDGSFSANFTLRLDDPIGIWQVYARQVSEQTKTITFTVE